MLSRPSGMLPIRRAERFFLATCFISNVIFIGTFQVFSNFQFTQNYFTAYNVQFLLRMVHNESLFILCHSTIFQSSLKSSFTTITHFKDIKTLKELDERGLPIGTSSGSLKKVFGSMENVFGSQNFSNTIIKSLKQKYILINSTKPGLDLVAYDKNVCCIERLTDCKLFLSVSG